MLPLLLASAFGIIVFSLNIFITDNQKKNPQAEANSILPKLNLDAAKAEAAKSEVKKTDNTRLPVPIGGGQSQRPAIKPAPAKEQVNTTRTEPPKNVSSNANAKEQNWSIQAGAFSIESSAVKVKDKIAQLGYDARVVKTGMDKPLFRVMVSPGNSRTAPNDALKKLNSIGIEGYIVSGRL